eukprot:TRINITY_DN16853_c0_g1_i1.p1 TRINITY_DN16853_c0_g1~~TRINITY_DN16853_c0_g1_i1.p1  ORF type:complete len:211 (+),score=47.99 TRINITY_DN16853_c0_g1_i1:42-635(+)
MSVTPVVLHVHTGLDGKLDERTCQVPTHPNATVAEIKEAIERSTGVCSSGCVLMAGRRVVAEPALHPPLPPLQPQQQLVVAAESVWEWADHSTGAAVRGSLATKVSPWEDFAVCLGAAILTRGALLRPEVGSAAPRRPRRGRCRRGCAGLPSLGATGERPSVGLHVGRVPPAPAGRGGRGRRGAAASPRADALERSG